MSVTRRPSVGVVVLNHNGRLLAERCLQSVVRAGYPQAELILVDNDSTDGSVAYLTERFPGVTVVSSAVNLGVTGGRNLGFREAMGKGHDYILSLDSDARIDVSLIEELVATAEADPRIGVLGPKTYNDDETRTIQCVGGRILWTENVTRERGAGEPDRGQYDTLTDIDYIPGFGFMARRDVFEQLDALDETFEGYGHEDTDFCLRARKLGYRIVYVPRAVLWHKGSATIGGYSARRKYLEAVNSVLLARRYGTAAQRVKYAVYAGLGLFYALAVQTPRGNARSVWAKARGLWRGLWKPLPPPPSGRRPPTLQDPAIHHWYQENADRFESAAVIEVPFLDLSDEAQQRMNRFKLAAISSGAYVSLKDRRVVEFGAGHGRLPLAYPDMASYLGVDYSANLVALGNKRIANAGLSHRARLVHGDVMSFDGEESASDVVCSLGMLAYMPDAEAVLRRMAALVTWGGSLFVDFRCESPLYGTLRRIKWAIRKPTGGITYALSPSRVEEVLRTVGCTDIRIVAREFPLLAELHARFGWTWPRALRDAMAERPLFRPLATEAWAFARWRPPHAEGR